MPASPAATVVAASLERPRQLDELLGTIMPFVKVADALARRTVGKVRTLAMIGLLAALWIAYASGNAFGWRAGATLVLFFAIAIPSAVLWKIHGMLSSTIGLPQRTIDTAARVYGMSVEHSARYESRGMLHGTRSKPALREMYRTARSVLELKALTDEAREIVALAGSALVLANPLFGILLLVSAAVTALLALVGAIVGLAYLL